MHPGMRGRIVAICGLWFSNGFSLYGLTLGVSALSGDRYFNTAIFAAAGLTALPPHLLPPQPPPGDKVTVARVAQTGSRQIYLAICLSPHRHGTAHGAGGCAGGWVGGQSYPLGSA
jgi:hypothetical protein